MAVPANPVKSSRINLSVHRENRTKVQESELSDWRDDPTVTWDNCTIVSRTQEAYGTREEVLGSLCGATGITWGSLG